MVGISKATRLNDKPRKDANLEDFLYPPVALGTRPVYHFFMVKVKGFY